MMLSRLGIILTKAIRMVNSSKFLLLFDLTHPMHRIGSWTQTAKAHITNDPSIFFIFYPKPCEGISGFLNASSASCVIALLSTQEAQSIGGFIMSTKTIIISCGPAHFIDVFTRSTKLAATPSMLTYLVLIMAKSTKCVVSIYIDLYLFTLI